MTHYTILGAEGFVGSALAKKLSASGHQVDTPGRNADLFDKDLGNAFYCIGLTADYAARPYDTIDAHVSLLSRLLEKATFKRLVYLSSTRLYDSSKSTHEAAELTLNPANPRHLYDLSKALGENLCLTASNGRATVARLANVYDDAPDAPGFFSQLLQSLRSGRTLSLDASSGAVRDYIALEDVTEALVRIMDSGEAGIFNVASGVNISNQELVDLLNAHGCNVSLTKTSPTECANACDITQLKALGVTPIPPTVYLKQFLERI